MSILKFHYEPNHGTTLTQLANFSFLSPNLFITSYCHEFHEIKSSAGLFNNSIDQNANNHSWLSTLSMMK